MKARLLIVFIFEVVLNTEWGALGNTGSLDFVRTWWDQSVGAGSKNFGKQVLKSAAIFANAHFLFCCKLCPKLIVNRLKCGLLKGLWKAGMYLGELFRQVDFGKNWRTWNLLFICSRCYWRPPLPRGGHDENSWWAQLSSNLIHLGDQERCERWHFIQKIYLLI